MKNKAQSTLIQSWLEAFPDSVFDSDWWNEPHDRDADDYLAALIDFAPVEVAECVYDAFFGKTMTERLVARKRIISAVSRR